MDCVQSPNQFYKYLLIAEGVGSFFAIFFALKSKMVFIHLKQIKNV